MGILTIPMRWRARLVAENFRPLLKSGERVLDVGCGCGAVGRELAARLGVKVVGADIADQRKPGASGEFVLIPAEGRWPLASGAFDAAVIVDVLHHASDPLELVKRALDASRRVLIFESEPSFLLRAYDAVANRMRYGTMPFYVARTAREWIREFDKHGLAALSFRPKGRWWYPVRFGVIEVRRGGEV